MSTSRTHNAKEVLIRCVVVGQDQITVTLTDGRGLSFPLSWYPRLFHGTPSERNNWELMGGGYGVHWPDLDEDLSVEGFLAGNPSFESPRSIKFWLDQRARGKKTILADYMKHLQREKQKNAGKSRIKAA
jgi:hypothetical protein